MTDLSTDEKRDALKPRATPYAQRIKPHCHLLFRKLAEGGTWIARRQVGKKRKHHRIGSEVDYTYEEALSAALEWLKVEPGQAVAPSQLTLGLVCSSYLSWRLNEKSESGAQSTKSLFDTHLFGHPIASKALANLKTADYQRWLDQTGDKLVRNHRHPEPEERRRLGRYTANTCWRFVKAALNRAYKKNRNLPREEWQAVEPLADGETVAREAFLSEAEIQRLINASEGDFRDLVLAGVLTGARFGEITRMKVRDLDLSEGIWRPSHSKTGKRGRRPRHLDPQTVEFLAGLCAGRAPADLVFTDNGKAWGPRYRRLMKEAAARAGLDPEISYYALRHSYISKQMKAGVQTLAIAENCGTSVKMLEEVYGHLKPSEKREALAKGAFKVELPKSNVVAL